MHLHSMWDQCCTCLLVSDKTSEESISFSPHSHQVHQIPQHHLCPSPLQIRPFPMKTKMHKVKTPRDGAAAHADDTHHLAGLLGFSKTSLERVFVRVIVQTFLQNIDRQILMWDQTCLSERLHLVVSDVRYDTEEADKLLPARSKRLVILLLPRLMLHALVTSHTKPENNDALACLLEAKNIHWKE